MKKILLSRYELSELEDPAPREIPQKRKRDHRGGSVNGSSSASNADSGLVPVKSRCPGEYMFGKLDVGDFVQVSGWKIFTSGFEEYLWRIDGKILDQSHNSLINMQIEELEYTAF
jgi:hypothetical protein